VPPAASDRARFRDGRNARWDEHREQRRRLILDAAIAVVSEAPPGAELRLQDVADRSGLVRTVVQRHFGGRLQLTRAVQADVLDQAFALITRPVDLSQTLYDVAHSLVGETVRWVVGNPSLPRPVTRLTYAQVNGAANQVANLLVERGIKPGDKVALSCPNLPYFPIVYYGILKAGASSSRSTCCSRAARSPTTSTTPTRRRTSASRAPRAADGRGGVQGLQAAEGASTSS
jgi:AcrR family transcriptional regulator